jgi:periplasmic copper chaperone A
VTIGRSRAALCASLNEAAGGDNRRMNNSRLVLPAATAIALTLAAAVSFVRAAEAIAGDLMVTGAWARATPPGADVGAAYVSVENRGGADDRLVSAASPLARSITLHRTVEADGLAQMRPLEAAEVPAGEKLEMRPGGAHMMLSGLQAPLKAGDAVPITLIFEKAGALTVSVAVTPIGADQPAQGGHHH